MKQFKVNSKQKIVVLVFREWPSDYVFMMALFVCFRPLSPSSVVCVYRSYGETPCWLCPASTPSAKHAGSSTAPYWSKMAWEWVSAVQCVSFACSPVVIKAGFRVGGSRFVFLYVCSLCISVLMCKCMLPTLHVEILF